MITALKRRRIKFSRLGLQLSFSKIGNKALDVSDSFVMVHSRSASEDVLDALAARGNRLIILDRADSSRSNLLYGLSMSEVIAVIKVAKLREDLINKTSGRYHAMLLGKPPIPRETKIAQHEWDKVLPILNFGMHPRLRRLVSAGEPPDVRRIDVHFAGTYLEITSH